MKCLSFEIEGIYFNCFRKPTSTSTIVSYSIPPFTTIRGVLSNCLGLGQFPRHEEYLLLQDEIKIGIQKIAIKGISKELSKILKLKKTGSGFRRVFPSSPMFREFLVNPEYKVYVLGNNEKIEDISKKLKNPERPLYLGQSDDMVDITNIKTIKTEKTESKKIHSVVEGIYENCEIVKIPYKFGNDGKSLQELTISLPMGYPLIIDEKVECYKCDDEYITAY
ncbi:MAG: CRISPR-associated protein Cas5 [Methanobacterium sp.]|uniref:CRISPR-associated protein Cas5 n=1 Tax=Methanobacterium sp. TaxID=2164 RepID=UPI003D65B1D8|nr:CRISPR-associated protein Cas5 [Methanobacterium sp.]